MSGAKQPWKRPYMWDRRKMVKKVYLGCSFLSHTPSPPPPLSLARKHQIVAVLIPHSKPFNFKIWNLRDTAGELWVTFPVLRGTGKAVQAKFTRSLTCVKGRNLGARMHIICQYVCNSYFLRLSHQILSWKAWVFLWSCCQWEEIHVTWPLMTHTCSLGEHAILWGLNSGSYYFAFIEVSAVQEDSITLFLICLRQKLFYFFMKFTWQQMDS